MKMSSSDTKKLKLKQCKPEPIERRTYSIEKKVTSDYVDWTLVPQTHVIMKTPSQEDIWEVSQVKVAKI